MVRTLKLNNWIKYKRLQHVNLIESEFNILFMIAAFDWKIEPASLINIVLRIISICFGPENKLKVLLFLFYDKNYMIVGPTFDPF